MSDAPETTDTPDQSRAVTVVKEKLISTSTVPIWDTAAFEQMGRVGVVMADSGLANETFFKDGDQAAPRNMVVARMVMVADVARDVGANPLMFLQVCSIISRKLHIEGKAVNAIIRARTGVNLKFRFGLWDTDHIVFPEVVTDPEDERFGQPVNPEYFNGVGERLAVRVIDPNDATRYVDGSVGLWKTDRKGSPWSNPGNWRRQLRYRGSPEWARAYEPGAVLGIYSDADEDLGDLFEMAPRSSGVASRLPGAKALPEGFRIGHTEAETGTTKRRGRPPKATAEPEVSEVLDAVLEGDDLPQGPADAPSVEEPSDTKESATPASTVSAEETSGLPDTSEPTSDGEPQEADVISEGYPNENEVYLVNGDEWIFDPRRGDERRTTYKNGDIFSDAGRDKGYRIYEDHAPEGNSEVGNPTTEQDQEVAEDDALPPEMQTYVDAIETVTTFVDAKRAMQAFFVTPTFKEMATAQQNRVRRDTAESLLERRSLITDLPDHADDISMFRLWIEAQDDPEAISGTWNALVRRPTFTTAPKATQDVLFAAKDARIEFIAHPPI